MGEVFSSGEREVVRCVVTPFSRSLGVESGAALEAIVAEESEEDIVGGESIAASSIRRKWRTEKSSGCSAVYPVGRESLGGTTLQERKRRLCGLIRAGAGRHRAKDRGYIYSYGAGARCIVSRHPGPEI